MNSRRGLTLIELLASLGLLSVLVVVCVSWVASSLRKQGWLTERARWDRAAYAVLDMIERDLLAIDELDPDLRARRVPRVSEEEVALRIRSRDRGWLGVIEYRWDERAQTLIRKHLGRQEPSSVIPLLGQLADFEVEVVPTSDTQPYPRLQVTLADGQGWAIGRMFVLSEEDVR